MGFSNLKSTLRPWFGAPRIRYLCLSWTLTCPKLNSNNQGSQCRSVILDTIQKKQGWWISLKLTDAVYNVVFIVIMPYIMLCLLSYALYNIVFIVIMYEVWIYFEHFVFISSLLFWGIWIVILLSYLVCTKGTN